MGIERDSLYFRFPVFGEGLGRGAAEPAHVEPYSNKPERFDRCYGHSGEGRNPAIGRSSGGTLDPDLRRGDDG